MNWQYITSLLFPSTGTANNHVKGGSSGGLIPILPSSIGMEDVGIKVPEKTALIHVNYHPHDTKFKDTTDTPVYIVKSSNDSHLITSDGTFVNLDKISRVTYLRETDRGWFGKSYSVYNPHIYIGGSVYQKIGNRDFYDLDECESFVKRVRQNINQIVPPVPQNYPLGSVQNVRPDHHMNL